MSVDITTLGLEIRSDGVVVASKRMRELEKDAGSVEKSFSKVGSASSMLMSKLMRLAGVIAGIFTIHKAKEYLVDITRVAGAYEMMGIAMHAAGKNAGYSVGEMDKFEASLKKSGIAALEARQSMTKLAVAGIDLAQSEKLARAAQDLAVVGRLNSSESFERLTTAIQRGQVIMLHTLGINATFEQGYEKMKKTLGDNVKELTEQQKVQARVNVVLEAAAKYQGIYEQSMTSAEKQYLSLTRHVQTYQIAFGKAFQPAYLEYVRAQTDLYKDLTKAVSDPQLQASLTEISKQFMSIYSEVVKIIASGFPSFILNITQALTGLTDVQFSFGSGFLSVFDNLDDPIIKLSRDIYLARQEYESLQSRFERQQIPGMPDFGVTIQQIKDAKIAYENLINGVEENLKKANEQLEKFQPDQSPWDKFITFMSGWGWDILSVFSLMGKTIGGMFATMLIDIWYFIKNIGKGFLSLSKIIEGAFALDSNKIKEGWKEIIDLPENIAKDWAGAWDSYMISTKKNWDDFVNDIESRRVNINGKDGGKNTAEEDAAAEAARKLAQAQLEAVQAEIENANKARILSKELEFQISLLGKTTKEQYLLTLMRDKEIDTTLAEGKAVEDLAGKYYDLKRAKERRAEELSPFMDFLSPADIKKTQDQMSEAEHALAQEKLQIWENTRNKIQDSMSDLFSKLNQADFGSFKDYMLEISGAAGSISGTYFSEQFMKSIQSGNLQDLFSGGMLKKMFPNSTGEEIAAGLLGTIAAGINAIASGNEFQMIGTALGAGIGAAIAGPLGMAVGSSIGNTVGSLFGGDDEPSYFSKLIDALDDLKTALEETIDALRDELIGTSKIESIIKQSVAAIKNDKIPGMDETLLETLNLPGGMKKRSGNPWSAPWKSIQEGIAEIPGLDFFDELYVKDKGYTAFDMNAEQLSDTFTALTDSFIDVKTGALDLVDLYNFMADSSQDAGNFIDKLLELNLLDPSIPERVIKWYSDKKGSKNIEEVTGAMAEQLKKAVYEVLIYTKGIVDQQKQYIDSFKTDHMTSFQKALRGLYDTFGIAARAAESMIPFLVKSMEMPGLSDEEISSIKSQIHYFRTAGEEYSNAITIVAKEFADQRMEIFKSSTQSLNEIMGTYTQFDAAIDAVASKWDGFIDKFLDSGGKIDSAGYTQLTGEKESAIKTTLENFWDEVLDTQGMTDYQKQLESLKETYRAYVKALKERGMWEEMATEAAQKFNLKIKELRESFVKDIIEGAQTIIDTQGMSDLDKTLYGINNRYQDQMDILKDTGGTLKEISTLQTAWNIEIRNAREEAYSAIQDFYRQLTIKIEDLIWDLQGGSLASVQSQEGMEARYNKLLQEAADTGNVDRFTSFITSEFIPFAKGFGNYGEVNAQIVKDLELLQTKFTADASLSDLDNQLSTANTSLSEIVHQTTLLTETIMKTNGFAAGGYHSGGLRIVGERGMELEATGPSRIYNNNQLSSFLSSMQNQGNVTVIVKMGTREFEDFTTETIRTNIETQKQVKRVANG